MTQEGDKEEEQEELHSAEQSGLEGGGALGQAKDETKALPKKRGMLPARRKAGEAPKQMGLPAGFRPPPPVKRLVVEEGFEDELEEEIELAQEELSEQVENFEQVERRLETESLVAADAPLERIESKLPTEALWQEGVANAGDESSPQHQRYKPPTNWWSFVPWVFGLLGVGWGLWMMGKVEHEKDKYDGQVQEVEAAQEKAQKEIEKRQELDSQLEKLEEELASMRSGKSMQILSQMEEYDSIKRELIQSEDELLALQAKYDELEAISSELLKGGAVGLAKILSMQPAEGRNAGRSVLAWDQSAGVGRLRWDGIPVLEDGSVYQVWAKERTAIHSLGFVSANPGDASSQTVTVNLPTEFVEQAKTEEIWVTIEPAGGSEMPAGIRIMSTVVR